MKERNIRIILVGVAVLILLYGCAVSENYKMGQDLVNQNRWDEAIGYFETAVKEEPANTEFKSRSSRRRVSRRPKSTSKRRNRPSAPHPTRNLRALEAIVKEGDIAYNLDPGNPAIKAFHRSAPGKDRSPAGGGQIPVRKGGCRYAEGGLACRRDEVPAGEPDLYRL